jgi:hypothetical protein
MIRMTDHPFTDSPRERGRERSYDPAFEAEQPADTLHRRLSAAARALRDAEQHVVLWLADLRRRRLHRQLGYPSPRKYAMEALGFSATRAGDLLRLADRLEELPRIRESVVRGELGYTKAREIVKVASPRTEDAWLAEAEHSTRRELERKVARTRQEAQARRRRRAIAGGTAQGSLLDRAANSADGIPSTAARAASGRGPAAGPPPTPDAGVQPAVAPSSPAATLDALLAEVPVQVGLRMTVEQRARYEALWQKLGATPNPEDLLEAMAGLVAERRTHGRVSCGNEAFCADVAPRGAMPPVQIHVHLCPECGAMEAGGRRVARADRERLRCDAAIATPGERNSTTIAPRVRREVVARDRHRCRTPGCHHTRFLEVHHVVPRERGGTNDPANLVTLCSACHRLWHERGRPGWWGER